MLYNSWMASNWLLSCSLKSNDCCYERDNSWKEVSVEMSTSYPNNNVLMHTYPNKLMKPHSSTMKPVNDHPISTMKIPNKKLAVPRSLWLWKRNEVVLSGPSSVNIPPTTRNFIVSHSSILPYICYGKKSSIKKHQDSNKREESC